LQLFWEKNPGNQHNNDTVEKFIPWHLLGQFSNLRIQSANGSLDAPGNVILELRHLLLPENAWKIFYPKKK